MRNFSIADCGLRIVDWRQTYAGQMSHCETFDKGLGHNNFHRPRLVSGVAGWNYPPYHQESAMQQEPTEPSETD